MGQRFSYVRYDDVHAKLQGDFKRLFEDIECLAASELGQSRAASLVMTKLEEAYMWVGKAIRDSQIEKDGKVVDEPKRG